MPLLTRKSQVAVKAESTEGTNSSPAAINAAFNIFEAGFSADIEQFDRNPFRSSVGRRASIPGVKTGTVSFTTELVGSGTATSAPPFAAALKSCGFIETAVKTLTISGTITSGPFVPGESISDGASFTTTIRAVDTTSGSAAVLYVDSTASSYPSTGTLTGGTSGANFAHGSGTLSGSAVGKVYSTTSTYSTSSAPSATVELRNDGIRHAIIGSRGNVSLTASTGQPMQMGFEFLGEKVATDDAAMLTGISYPTTTPPTLLSAAFSTHGHSAVLDNIEISTSNDLQIRRSINDASGVLSTQIVSRAMSGSIDPEMVTVATHDYFGSLDANTEGVTKFTVGSASGNKFIVIGAHSQFTGITPGERNGISIASIDLGFNESTLGDDDLQIVSL